MTGRSRCPGNNRGLGGRPWFALCRLRIFKRLFKGREVPAALHRRETESWRGCRPIVVPRQPGGAPVGGPVPHFPALHFIRRAGGPAAEQTRQLRGVAAFYLNRLYHSERRRRGGTVCSGIRSFLLPAGSAGG